MADDQLSKMLAVIAIVLAVIALGVSVTQQPTGQQIGIQGSFDPTMQPSILQVKEPLSTSGNAFSGVILTNQKINTTGGTGTPVVGELVFLSGSTWIKANPASSSTMAGKLGMVAKKPTSNTSYDGQILLQGLVYNSSWSLTRGSVYYANTTAGTFNLVKPSGTTVVQPIGYALNTSVIVFNPSINMTANGI